MGKEMKKSHTLLNLKEKDAKSKGRREVWQII